MEIKERISTLKETYTETQRIYFFTENAEQIYGIDIDNNTIYYSVSVTLNCGCCGDIEHREDNLDWFIGYMSECDFNDFIDFNE